MVCGCEGGRVWRRVVSGKPLVAGHTASRCSLMGPSHRLVGSAMTVAGGVAGIPHSNKYSVTGEAWAFYAATSS